MITKIVCKFIPHKAQRYDTVGDYYEKGNTLHFRISYFKNWRYHFLILIHEIVEKVICMDRHISDAEIDAFDMNYEGEEPGDDKNAPYYSAHQFATSIEKLVARELNVDWIEYTNAVRKK